MPVDRPVRPSCTRTVVVQPSSSAHLSRRRRPCRAPCLASPAVRRRRRRAFVVRPSVAQARRLPADQAVRSGRQPTVPVLCCARGRRRDGPASAQTSDAPSVVRPTTNSAVQTRQLTSAPDADVRRQQTGRPVRSDARQTASPRTDSVKPDVAQPSALLLAHYGRRRRTDVVVVRQAAPSRTTPDALRQRPVQTLPRPALTPAVLPGQARSDDQTASQQATACNSQYSQRQARPGQAARQRPDSQTSAVKPGRSGRQNTRQQTIKQQPSLPSFALLACRIVPYHRTRRPSSVPVPSVPVRTSSSDRTSGPSSSSVLGPGPSRPRPAPRRRRQNRPDRRRSSSSDPSSSSDRRRHRTVVPSSYIPSSSSVPAHPDHPTIVSRRYVVVRRRRARRRRRRRRLAVARTSRRQTGTNRTSSGASQGAGPNNRQTSVQSSDSRQGLPCLLTVPSRLVTVVTRHRRPVPDQTSSPLLALVRSDP